MPTWTACPEQMSNICHDLHNYYQFVPNYKNSGVFLQTYLHKTTPVKLKFLFGKKERAFRLMLKSHIRIKSYRNLTRFGSYFVTRLALHCVKHEKKVNITQVQGKIKQKKSQKYIVLSSTAP